MMADLSWNQVAAMNQHYRSWSFPYFLQQQQKLGIESLELWLGPPHFYLDRLRYEDCKRIRKIIKEYGITPVSVTSSSFAWQFQYASPDRETYEKGKDYFKNGIKAAAELGAKIMTVNSGWGYTQETEKEQFLRTVETLGELAETAGEQGMILALESLTSLESHIGNNLEKVKKIWETVNHKNLEIMVDTVAMGYQNETLEDWFHAFGEHMVHMHFIDMDQDGWTDDHLVWGDGGFHLDRMIETLKKYSYQGYLVQEIAADRYKMDPAEADRRGINKLRKYFK
ncbi:MAG: sugar phosphate isomerase/epimerase [Lachnospiraceae bacterium]|jgi:protein FrlC|nr:sugar phosphate isomerase/epimerase [Lachnospiraceae bacterium]MCI9590727.1 sugar phosphate isomerase/epimerase [Lachnospiraceae bacterium]